MCVCVCVSTVKAIFPHGEYFITVITPPPRSYIDSL